MNAKKLLNKVNLQTFGKLDDKKFRIVTYLDDKHSAEDVIFNK